MPERIQKIKSWLEEELGLAIQTFQPASNDASFRRYFRVSFAHVGSTTLSVELNYIVMDAPPEKEDIRTFVDVANYFEQFDVHVPHIYAENERDGFLLLGDLGVTAYLGVLNDKNVDSLYHDAFNTILKLQMAKTAPSHIAEFAHSSKQTLQLPIYSEQLLKKEMQLLEDWFIDVHLQYVLSLEEKALLHETIERILEEVIQQPQVIVHRDYHSRNLMLTDDRNPGVIDFQDAVLGPCTYDLVSLINDSYIAWPTTKVEEWIEAFRHMLLDNDVIEGVEPLQFKRWFHVMAMQRQIKVVGIFCRLFHRDGKSNYLNDIPQTMRYLLRNSAQLADYADFYQLMLKLNHLFEKKDSEEL